MIEEINNKKTEITISKKEWLSTKAPERILVIRLHAFGDVIITLPYLLQLKKDLPANTKIDFITLRENAPIPVGINLFSRVYKLNGNRNFRKQIFFASMLLPRLLLHKYNVIIDLQNNEVSNYLKKKIRPEAWSSFDRFSSFPAGERTRLTIEAVFNKKNFANTNFTLKDKPVIASILKQNGWIEGNKLVLINPAGAFETRNWPASYYFAFCELWLKKFPASQFVIMGTNVIYQKALFFKNELKENVINLTNKTNAIEAFALMQKITFALTEDSGLMHVAWICGVPTLALFGSTRCDWSKPLGHHSMLLSSDDMECGNCMLEKCKFNDVRCLTRYTPDFVFEKAMQLINNC